MKGVYIKISEAYDHKSLKTYAITVTSVIYNNPYTGF